MAEGTEVNEENYRALQREIINTQIKLTDLKNENSGWNKTGNFLINLGNELDKISNKIDSLGNKLTTRLSIPIAGVLTVATKEAVEFESAFTGVTKTVDATEEQLEVLKQGIKNLSKEVPSTTTEIAAVAEAAGQLGIETENILSFSKAMIDLGNSTNLTADEAASQLAKFANITQMSQKDFDKLGATIVDLGNNYATTEADIVNMAMRLAGAGKQVGFSEAEIMGLATALSSVGIEAEMGGSAISKAMVKMQNAVEQGGTKLDTVLKKTGMTLRELELMSANDSMGFKELSQSIGMTSTEVKQLITAGTNLEDFASVSGMSAEEFKKAWKEDAAGALSAFIKGLGNAEDKGESAITMLSEMGLTEVRLRDSLLRAANAGTLFNDAINDGTKAWENNVALTNEANKRYKTTESQYTISKNKIKDIAISLGDKLLPAVNKTLDKVDKWTEKLDNLSDSQKENIVKIGLMVAAIGPLLKVGATAISTIGKVSSGIGTFTKAIGLAKNGIGTATGSAATLAQVFQGLSNPASLAAIGITAAVGIIIAEIAKAEEKTKKAYSEMADSFGKYTDGLQNAEGYLSDFNSTLFTTIEEQESLQKEMDEIQSGITQICKTASDERRGYTQEEITQLDEYFQKLRELKNREIEIQQQITGAITQQAVTNAETFQGSLEEYKVQSQEWITTARKQAQATIDLIEEGTIQEVALLNQRYGEEATMQNEAYATEYNNIMTQKQAKIDAANAEVTEITSAYTNGYTNRLDAQDIFNKQYQQYLANFTSSIEQIEDSHRIQIERINNLENLSDQEKAKAIERVDSNIAAQKKYWYKQMYEEMDESQKEQLNALLEMAMQTELQGGKLTDETQKIVDRIIESYEGMPDDTKEQMEQTMKGMLEGMEKDEPTLYAKATTIANGVIARLKKTFDIHSPSKETRGIFQNVMKGAELGLDDEEKNLNRQIDTIANQMKTRFANMVPNMGAIKQSVIEKTQTVFTTPTLNIYAQDELTPNKINTIIDTVNRRLGSQY